MDQISSVGAVLGTGYSRFGQLWLVTIALVVGSSVAPAQADGDADLIRHCIECHGADGIARNEGVPHINGQADYLMIEMFKTYQQRKRPIKVSAHREIPAGDVQPIAKYYAGQKAQRPKSVTDPELVAKGEKIYLNRCADCHLDNGRESDKGAPLTAAQEVNYLIEQTLAFKTGERKFAFLMDNAYRGLSDEELSSVAHFFAAQVQIAPHAGRRKRR